MAFKILTDNGVDNTNIDGARSEYFAAGMRDGIVKGAFNEGTFSTLESNVIGFDTCELRVSGHRIISDEMWYHTFASTPASSVRYALIGQLVVDGNSDVTFDLIIRDANISLVKNNLFATETGAGTYEVEIGRFTLTTSRQIEDIVRTLDTITGGGTADSELHWGTITAYGLGHNEDPEADFEQRYDEEQGYMVTDVSLGIPSGSIDNLDDTLSTTSHNAIENQAVTNALNAKADANDVTNKMDKTNPSGTGSFSLNRGFDEQTIGNKSFSEGDNTCASGHAAHSEGAYTIARGDSSHAEGAGCKAFGDYSHAEGYYTIANRLEQHVFGKLNIMDTQGANANERGKYIEIVGNGTDFDARSNARTLDWDGNEYLAGKLQADGGFTDGNNDTYVAKLPDTTDWSKNEDIATCDGRIRIHEQSTFSGSHYYHIATIRKGNFGNIILTGEVSTWALDASNNYVLSTATLNSVISVMGNSGVEASSVVNGNANGVFSAFDIQVRDYDANNYRVYIEARGLQGQLDLECKTHDNVTVEFTRTYVTSTPSGTTVWQARQQTENTGVPTSMGEVVAKSDYMLDQSITINNATTTYFNVDFSKYDYKIDGVLSTTRTSGALGGLCFFPSSYNSMQPDWHARWLSTRTIGTRSTSGEVTPSGYFLIVENNGYFYISDGFSNRHTLFNIEIVRNGEYLYHSHADIPYMNEQSQFNNSGNLFKDNNPVINQLCLTNFNLFSNQTISGQIRVWRRPKFGA